MSKTIKVGQGILIVAVFLLFFKIASASVLINEIMYNLKVGSDDGREWVEILNNGSAEVNLSDWRLVIGGENHKILPNPPVVGDAVIPAGSLAIIADDPGKFLTDWPNFQGLILKSSFSLNNSSSTLSLKTNSTSSTVEDFFTYSSSVGASGNGDSLQKIDGVWKASAPTPGMANVFSGTTNSANSNDQSTATNTSSGVTSQNQTTSFVNGNSGGTAWPVDPQIFAKITAGKTTIAGADALFSGDAVGLEKKPLSNPRYLWNFGDGETKEGQSVMHDFAYPGNYVVVLNVSSGLFSGTDRVIVKALAPDISISRVAPGVDGMIEIENKMSEDLNLSWWRIESNGNFFTIPEGTVILPKQKIPFASKITKLNVSLSDAKLLFPNGMIAVDYAKQNVVVEVLPATSPDSQNTVAKQFVSQPAKQPVKIVKTTEQKPKPIIEPANQDPTAFDDPSYATGSAAALQAAAVKSLPAKAGNSSSGSGHGIWKWLLAVFGLVAVASIVVFQFGKKPENDSKNVSDEDYGDIKIIED